MRPSTDKLFKTWKEAHGEFSPEVIIEVGKRKLKQVIFRAHYLKTAILASKVNREFIEKYRLTREEVIFFYLYLRIWNKMHDPIGSQYKPKDRRYNFHGKRGVYLLVSEEARQVEREEGIKHFLTKSKPYMLGFLNTLLKKKLIVLRKENMLKGIELGDHHRKKPDHLFDYLAWANLFNATIGGYSDETKQREDTWLRTIPPVLDPEIRAMQELRRERLFKVIRKVKQQKAWDKKVFTPKYEERNEIVGLGTGFDLSNSDELEDTELHRVSLADLERCLRYYLLGRYDPIREDTLPDDVVQLQRIARDVVHHDVGFFPNDLFSIYDQESLEYQLSFGPPGVSYEKLKKHIEEEIKYRKKERREKA